jgi:hypothetical protein
MVSEMGVSGCCLMAEEVMLVVSDGGRWIFRAEKKKRVEGRHTKL